MKHLISYILITSFIISCKSQKENFQPMAAKIKNYFLKNIPNAKSVDTIYLMIDTVTPQLKWIIQSAEYGYAATNAKKIGNSDSTALKDTSDWMDSQLHTLNNSKFLFYRAMPLVIYTKNNMEKSMAEQWLFFNKEFKLIPKYSFIYKVSIFDNNDLREEEYVPFSTEQIEDFRGKGILRYYWNK